MMPRNANTILLAAVLVTAITAPAAAVDVWTGNKLDDVFGSESSITEACRVPFDWPKGNVPFKAFFSKVKANKDRINGQIATTIQALPAVTNTPTAKKQLAVQTKERDNYTLKVSCGKNGTISFISLDGKTQTGNYANLYDYRYDQHQ